MKWLREPLVQFLLLGATLFAIFAIWGGPSTAPAGQYRIVLAPGMVDNLAVSFQRSENRVPTDKEMDALVADYVREEILNREARALGLDQDDPQIRRQLSGKMEYFLEDSATVPQPTDEQLTTYLQKNAVTFRKPDGTLPTLAEAHDAVLAAWQADQRRQTANAAYEKLRARYTVVVEKPATPAASTDKK